MRIIETILISRKFLLYIINNASSKAIFFKKMSSKPPPQQVLYNYYLLRCAVHLPFSWYLSDFNNFTSTNIQNNTYYSAKSQRKKKQME